MATLTDTKGSELSTTPILQSGETLPRKETPRHEELDRLWQGLLETYAQIVKEWHIWQQFSVWGKYPASRTINFGSPELDGLVAAAVGKSLFANLDVFLLSPSDTEKQNSSRIRAIDEACGATTSLFQFTEKLENILPDGGGGPLNEIRQDMRRYDSTEGSRFWRGVTEAEGCAEIGRGEKWELVKSRADEQASSENGNQRLLSTYIKTFRNVMAHNQRAPRIYEEFLVYVGYETGQEGLLEQAIRTGFNFLKRIDSEFCEFLSEGSQDLDDWSNNLHAHASSLGQELKLAIDKSVCEKMIEEKETEHDSWVAKKTESAMSAGAAQSARRARITGTDSWLLHTCEVNRFRDFALPFGYRLSGFRQGYFSFCDECAAKVNIICLESDFEDFEVSAISENGDNLMPEKPSKCIIVEGAWRSSLQVLYPRVEGEMWDYSNEEKVDVRIKLWGALLWETTMTRERLVGPGQLDCHTNKTEIPTERYLEIQRSRETTESSREAAQRNQEAPQ